MSDVYKGQDGGRTFKDMSKAIVFLVSVFKKRNFRVSGTESGGVSMRIGGYKHHGGSEGL